MLKNSGVMSAENGKPYIDIGPMHLQIKPSFATRLSFSLDIRHIFTRKCTNLRKKYVETQNRHK